MFQRTASPLSISDSATKRRRSAGLQKVIRIVPAMPLGTLGLSRYSTPCAATRVSKSLSQRFLLRRTDRRREPEEILRGTETAQRLQSCDRLRSRRLAADANSDAGFPVPRDSKLGHPAGDNADCDWFPHCPRDRVGI